MDIQSGFSYKFGTIHKYSIEDGALVRHDPINEHLRALREESNRLGNTTSDDSKRTLLEKNNQAWSEEQKAWEEYHKRNKDTQYQEATYTKLLSINTKSEKEILDYYNSYGPLQPSLIYREEMPLSHGPSERDKIETVIRAIRYFQLIEDLTESIISMDIKNTLLNTYNLVSYRNGFCESESDNYWVVEECIDYARENAELDARPEGKDFFYCLLDRYKEFDNEKEIINQVADEYIADIASQNRINESTASSHTGLFWSPERQCWASNPEIIKREKYIVNTNKDKNNSIILNVAANLVSDIISAHIKHTKPKTIITPHGVEGSWVCRHPLCALYFEYHLDKCKQVILRKCANKNCGEYFKLYGADLRKIYCSESCKNATKQRRHRKKLKEIGNG